ncbi:Hsp20/alpha crystallin family protein [Flavobacterium salilacus subsp. salilacus]|uniref:Hsp20/alpha crystallin family protein n=1 Tax=Flavobacterium TaxID=237 RepID=UPI0010752739|nr:MULTISPECIES: Hsp20/alpha crystallin family protein [Flavobacterium]KAF2519433.1 Hsp20/alpha crystallin family protein [Flavobacterium salilacus subsp. salilacus]MBE1614675.1 Hsp20/alpha crystallin family protein [Flavobacterium sp. SaA2.13]
MNLVKRNNSNVNGLFPSIMDEIFKDWAGGSQMVNKMIPPVNIKETDNAFTVALMAPGFKKEDFNIEVENDLLTISYEIKNEKTEQEEGKFTRREFSYSSFKRAFTLPESVNTDDINASYQDGILTIMLPKKEDALPKAKRLIEIS